MYSEEGIASRSSTLEAMYCTIPKSRKISSILTINRRHTTSLENTDNRHAQYNLNASYKNS